LFSNTQAPDEQDYFTAISMFVKARITKKHVFNYLPKLYITEAAKYFLYSLQSPARSIWRFLKTTRPMPKVK